MLGQAAVALLDRLHQYMRALYIPVHVHLQLNILKHLIYLPRNTFLMASRIFWKWVCLWKWLAIFLASKAFTTFAAQNMMQQPRNCSKSDCFRVLREADIPQLILSTRKGLTGVIVNTCISELYTMHRTGCSEQTRFPLHAFSSS